MTQLHGLLDGPDVTDNVRGVKMADLVRYARVALQQLIL